MAATHGDLDRLRPATLFTLLFTGPALGAVLGAVTNAINGAVSPEYFRTVMEWENVANVWRASVAQGVFEGLLFGLAFGVLFALLVGILSKGCSPYPLAARYLLAVAGGAAVGWVLGGLVAMGLVLLSPEFFRHTFRDAPKQLSPMLRYAWVGGSIWGLQLGGLGALIVGCVAFGTRWRRLARTRPWRPGLETDAHCGRCGYIVKGLAEPRCPECGADLRDVGVRAQE
jgi:hypothetical protein